MLLGALWVELVAEGAAGRVLVRLRTLPVKRLLTPDAAEDRELVTQKREVHNPREMHGGAETNQDLRYFDYELVSDLGRDRRQLTSKHCAR